MVTILGLLSGKESLVFVLQPASLMRGDRLDIFAELLAFDRHDVEKVTLEQGANVVLVRDRCLR